VPGTRRRGQDSRARPSQPGAPDRLSHQPISRYYYAFTALTSMFMSWANARLVAGDSVALVHIMRMVLGAVLARAMREELLQRNVAVTQA